MFGCRSNRSEQKSSASTLLGPLFIACGASERRSVTSISIVRSPLIQLSSSNGTKKPSINARYVMPLGTAPRHIRPREKSNRHISLGQRFFGLTTLAPRGQVYQEDPDDRHHSTGLNHWVDRPHKLNYA